MLRKTGGYAWDVRYAWDVCIRLFLLFQIIGNRFHLAPEDRKIMADNFPNHLLIDTEIFMYYDDSQAHNLPPGNFGILLPQLRRKVSARLTDDLNLSETGILHHLVSRKDLIAGVRIFSIRTVSGEGPDRRMVFRPESSRYALPILLTGERFLLNDQTKKEKSSGRDPVCRIGKQCG